MSKSKGIVISNFKTVIFSCIFVTRFGIKTTNFFLLGCMFSSREQHENLKIGSILGMKLLYCRSKNLILFSAGHLCFE